MAVNSFILHNQSLDSLIVIQASALPGLLIAIAMTAKGLNC
jgi:hypothetical protein